MATKSSLLSVLVLSLAARLSNAQRYKPPSTVTVTTTTTTTTTTSACSSSPTCPVLCIDNVDACGQMYGGCVPHCSEDPWPTFSTPYCSITPTSVSTPPPYPTSSCSATKCSDFLDSCGRVHGTCFADCPGSPTPTFPPCTEPTGHPTPTGYPTPTESCSQTICVDYVNECGMMYGGCHANCPGLPTPTYTPPPCTTGPTGYPTPTESCTQTICVDYINSCGMWYGGCHANCPGLPTPTYTPPPCSMITMTTSGSY